MASETLWSKYTSCALSPRCWDSRVLTILEKGGPAAATSGTEVGTVAGEAEYAESEKVISPRFANRIRKSSDFIAVFIGRLSRVVKQVEMLRYE